MLRVGVDDVTLGELSRGVRILSPGADVGCDEDVGAVTTGVSTDRSGRLRSGRCKLKDSVAIGDGAVSVVLGGRA